MCFFLSFSFLSQYSIVIVVVVVVVEIHNKNNINLIEQNYFCFLKNKNEIIQCHTAAHK
jgi:hypothetical protein